MFALFNPVLTMLAALALPALVFVLALWLEDAAGDLAPVQLGLLAWLPVLVLAVGIGISLRFNRIRVFAALTNLLVGYAALMWLGPTLNDLEYAALIGFAALLLPLNHLACHVLPEHGALSSLKLTLAGALGLEAALFGIVAGTHWEGAIKLLVADVFGFADPADFGLSDIGVVSTVILLALSFARLYTLTTIQRAALFVSGYCLVLVLANHDAPATLIAFASGGGLILAIAAFQESWNIAYLDQLTELPGRRALDEALARLDGGYTVAMVDVDHFKKFNDTWGHDVGDQVLRMVAAQLRDVGGGGKAYRYGGEEFTLLFPGRTAEQARPAVEAIREMIGRDSFEIRRHDRRDGDRQKPGATAQAGAGPISITVSAGLAERSDRDQPAGDVIKRADEALYEAKRAGRNRVCMAS